MKILIAEDDQFLKKLYQRIFEEEKYEVVVVEDGATAVEQMKTLQPDVVLMDIIMPKLNGLDVLQQVKADPQLKKIPVIMLTNLASEGDNQLATIRGASAYLVKSDYNPSELVAKVKEVLELPPGTVLKQTIAPPAPPAQPETPKAATPANDTDQKEPKKSEKTPQAA